MWCRTHLYYKGDRKVVSNIERLFKNIDFVPVGMGGGLLFELGCASVSVISDMQIESVFVVVEFFYILCCG